MNIYELLELLHIVPITAKELEEHHQLMLDSGQCEAYKGRVNYDQTGLIHTEETKKLISNKLKGRSFTDEHKRRISEASKRRPKRILTEEHKKKIGNSCRGKPKSEQGAANIRAANLIKNKSPEMRQKIAASNQRRAKARLSQP